MKRFLMIAATVAITALCLFGSNLDAQETKPAAKPKSGGKAASTPTDWKILGAAGDVKAGSMYTLINNTNQNSVRHGKRTWGINLMWDRSTSLSNIHFEVPGGGKSVLKYGDKVAIHVKNGGFLKYQRRDVGINLVWSTPAVFEWTILGGKKGSPVKTGALLSLFNEPENDFIIYAERPAGINIRWWKDRDLAGASLASRIRAAAEEMVRNEFTDRAKDYLKPSSEKKTEEKKTK